MRPRGQMGGAGGGPLGMVLTPWVKRLMIATGVVSILGSALYAWATVKWPMYLAFEPRALWGESELLPGVPALWQVVTYPLFMPVDAGFAFIGLAFAILMYGWFAGSLEVLWGSKRFIINFLILAVGSAILTALVGAFFPTVGAIQVAGPWAVMDGLLIAWGLSYPDQKFLLFFVLPMKGIYIVWMTLGAIALFMLVSGPSGFVTFIPHLFGCGLGFVIVSDKVSLRKTKLMLQKYRIEQQLKREEANRKKKRDKMGLHVVEDDKDDDDEPKNWVH